MNARQESKMSDDLIYSEYLVTYGRIRAGSGPSMTPSADGSQVQLYAAMAVAAVDAATAQAIRTKKDLLTEVQRLMG
jgi:hypothetical protein